VDFVHRVIESLQQHATEIVTIDRFFTESSAFPLPAGDPNYVVGRLKKYATKLSLSRNQHALNSFFQSQCERTALTNTHEALVKQVTAAVLPEEEYGDPENPTLRGYFLQVLVPVYACIPFSCTAGWVVAVPVLRAVWEIISSLETAVDTNAAGSLQAAKDMLDTLLDSLRYAANDAINSRSEDPLRRNELPETFQSPALMTVFTLLIQITSAALPCVSRFHDLDSRAAKAITFILRAAHYAVSFLFPNEYPDVVRPLDIYGHPLSPPRIFLEGRRNAEQNIPRGLMRQWGLTDGSYWFQRGTARETIFPPEIGERNDTARELRDAVRELTRVACRAHGFESVVREAAGDVWQAESRGRPVGNGHTLFGLGEVLV
jgi:hypothetical protein